MDQHVSIGEFARLTHLSVKTLRHYHDVGVLVPTTIDPSSGYRKYDTDQVWDAHLIRRLRDLDMPIPEIRTVLDAPDESARNDEILAYLARMERELNRTQEAVASLRSLLEREGTPIAVEHRTIDATPAIAVRGDMTRSEVGAWCAEAFPRLYIALAESGETPAGPGGGLYAPEWFENGAGHVVAFVPTARPIQPHDGLEPLELPPATLAIAVHVGAFDDLDRTYGALGSHVATHDDGLDDPIREHYLVSPGETDDPARFRTEVCWPISGSPAPA